MNHLYVYFTWLKKFFLFLFQVGYKARLAKLGSMFYPICIIATELEEKYIWELKLAILMDSLQMFSLREQETPECVKMDVVTIEE